MKKVAFYLYNPGLEGVDCSGIFSSNPGIGGTEHVLLLVASMLNRLKDKYEVTLFLDEPLVGLEAIQVVLVKGFEDSLFKAEQWGMDILIFKHMSEYCNNDLLKCKTPRLALLPWVHLFLNRTDLDYYFNNNNVKRVICVGREQRDLFLDHPCIKKMCYISNTLNTDLFYKQRVEQYPFAQRKHIVTYVGSLVPEKCFHHLAAIWKDIVNEVPDAELYVVGSGSLYDRTKKMGKYGIAQEDYEDWFMPFLMEDEQLLPSVHFLGRMGKEKEDILFQTKVGVPNPWGLSETFCISAVEMQLCGATVVSGECPGYYDTFINGVIVKDRGLLKEHIISQLLSKNPVLDYSSTYRIISEKFGYDSVLQEWDNLISNIRRDLPLPKDILNRGYRLKWLKIVHLYFIIYFGLFFRGYPVETVLQKIDNFRKYRAY